MEKTTDFLARLEQFIHQNEDELQRVQEELREIDGRIRQSTSEIERFSRRHQQLDSQVASMETNLESYAHHQIRSAYNAKRESQVRLLTMRSERKRLQDKQQFIEKYLQQLQNFTELTQIMPSKEALMRAEVSSSQATSQMTASMARVIDAQEDERLALAHQMHDGPAQSLSNLVLRAEICERLFDTDIERARQELSELRSFTTRTFEKVRDFIFELRPMILNDLGLAPTLRRFIGTFDEKNTVAVHLQLTGQERRLPPPIEITLFRAIQELVNNAVNHGNATKVQVNLELQSKQVTVVVEDNGSGFNINESLAAKPKTGTLGLAALRERVLMVGGNISSESAVGLGTRVTIAITDLQQRESQLQ